MKIRFKYLLRNTFILSFSLVTVAFSSCNKTSVDQPETVTPEPEKETVTLTFSVKNLHNDKGTDTEKEGYDTYNFLGYGYDVTGKYSHKTSIKAPVINTPSFVENNSGRFDVLRVLNSSFKYIYATDAQDLTQWLSNGIPNNRYFKGNITHPFPDTDPNSGQYIYGLYDSYIQYNRLSLYSRADLFIPYLTEIFKTDSKSLTPDELVKKYGTHILLSLYTGAKLSLDYQAKYTVSDRRKAIQNSFRAGLYDCFRLFAGILDPIDSTTFKDVNTPVIAFEAIGGDPSKISIDNTSGTNPRVNLKGWQESIKEENARFIYIDDLKHLTPIYEFITDTKKRQEVKSYMDEYIKANEVKLR